MGKSVKLGQMPNAPAFSAYQSTLQSVPTSGAKIQFQTEEFDTASAYDNATNFRFQPLVAGYYQIDAAVTFNPAVAGALVGVYKNGSIWKWGPQSTGTSSSAGASALVYLNGSTDYVEVYGYHSAGVANNTTAGAGATYFQGILVRAA